MCKSSIDFEVFGQLARTSVIFIDSALNTTTISNIKQTAARNISTTIWQTGFHVPYSKRTRKMNNSSAVRSNKRLKPDTVVDDQGRQRFHGAFTGGFSAGYFNTVGSEGRSLLSCHENRPFTSLRDTEGFQPATFNSSRKNRATIQSQSIHQFADESDGIIGGRLGTQKARSPSPNTYDDDDDDDIPGVHDFCKKRRWR